MLGRRNPPDSTFDFLSDPTGLPSEFKGWLRNWLLNQPATTTGTATALPTGNAGGDLTGSTYPSPVLKASGVTAATYGDSTHVAQVAVNAKGLVTSASNVALAASGYATVQDEGTPLTQRSTMNFVGAGVTASDSGSLTTVTIPGGGGSGLLFYAQKTSSTAIASTSETSPTAVLALGTQTYAAVATWIEFFTPDFTTAGGTLSVISLWDGVPGSGGTEVNGFWGVCDSRATSGSLVGNTLFLKTKITPSAGSHNYGVYAFALIGVATSTNVNGGAGGNAAFSPAYIMASTA